MSSECSRRKALKVAVGAICSESGFSKAEDNVLETLTEMVQSYIFEVGKSTRAFCELSCRTEPLVSDVVMSLVEMGTNINSIQAYAKRPNRKVIQTPQVSGPQSSGAKALPIGDKRLHPSHIPDYLPPFPDPHTYIRTVTHREPEVEYQALREKAANQKRDVERALTRFIAKTGETESLFSDDPYAFPLIANKPKPLPYLDAVLPKEQESETGEDENKDKSQAAISAAQVQQKADADKETLAQEQRAAKTKDASITTDTVNTPGQSSSLAMETNTPTGGVGETATSSDPLIDNPYLRAIIMPKISRNFGKKTTYTSSLKW